MTGLFLMDSFIHKNFLL